MCIIFYIKLIVIYSYSKFKKNQSGIEVNFYKLSFGYLLGNHMIFLLGLVINYTYKVLLYDFYLQIFYLVL